MRPHLALAAAALALASTDLMAYQIIGSHYHVEVEPNQFIDQLVLRCGDGHEVTVPWQSRLAEACGEDLMGNVTHAPSKAVTAPADEQQKQTMLKQLHAHYNNLPDQDVEFSSGPDGLSAHFTPPMVEILKRYEACRKTHKDKISCATERDRAMAALSDGPAPAAAAPDASTPSDASITPAKEATPAPAKKTLHSKRAHPPQPAVVETARSEPAPLEAPREPTAATPEAAPVAAAAAATPSSASEGAPVSAASPATSPVEKTPAADTRASAEKKIGEDYVACMRNKPKFDCDEARAKAIAALDRGSKPTKPQQRAHKRASRDVAAQPVASQ